MFFMTKLDPAGVGYTPLDDDKRLGLAINDAYAGANVAVDRMLEGAPIYNQIGESCVGETEAQMAGALSQVAGKRVLYSALAAYYLARLEEAKWRGGEIDVNNLDDNGTFPWAALTAWQLHGLPTEEEWPHDPSLLQRPPGWGAAAEGELHKLTRFYSVESSGDQLLSDIELAVRSNTPVGITIPVDSALVQHKGPNVLGPRTGRVLGLHRVPILAMDTSGNFYGPNSWGNDWGYDGLIVLGRQFVVEQAKDVTVLVAAG